MMTWLRRTKHPTEPDVADRDAKRLNVVAGILFIAAVALSLANVSLLIAGAAWFVGLIAWTRSERLRGWAAGRRQGYAWGFSAGYTEATDLVGRENQR